jgi:hypothetical protein
MTETDFILRQQKLDLTRCIDCGEPAKGWLRCTSCNSESQELNREERYDSQGSSSAA